MDTERKNKILDAVGIREFLRIFWREKYGGQVQAAKALGMSTAMLSCIVRGTRNPSQEILLDAGIVRKETVTYEVIE